MRRIIALCLAVVFLIIALIIMLSLKPGKTEINVVALKGPTAIGMIKLMEDSEQKASKSKYDFSILGTADEIIALLTKGEVDIAAIPANLAATLYNKTEGSIQICAVNTLGVLYILDTAGEIASVADLKGKTVYSVGKGTTPEFALNYVLEKNGLIPGSDVIIEYKSEAAELAALLSSGQAEIAMLPEPYATTVLAQNESIKIALSLTEEWDKVQPDFNLLTGSLVTTRSFAKEHKSDLDNFLKEYKDSIEFVSTNIDDAADLTVKFGIIPKPEIAKSAIPRCNIVYIDGDQMISDVKGYLGVLFEADEKSVGGKLPDDEFYFKK